MILTVLSAILFPNLLRMEHTGINNDSLKNSPGAINFESVHWRRGRLNCKMFLAQSASLEMPLIASVAACLYNL